MTSDPSLSRRKALRRLGGMTAAGAGLAGVSALRTNTPAPAANTARFDVRDYGARPNSMLDDSAAFQAAIDACAAQGGGEVYVPPFRFRAVSDLRTGVHLVGDGWQSQIYAPPTGSNAVGPLRPIIGSGGRDNFYHGVRDLMLLGYRQGGSMERGIELVSSLGDMYAVPPGGSGHPNDPSPIIQNVFVRDTGAEGIYLGRNMRGAFVHNCLVKFAGTGGLVLKGTDMQISNVQVGGTKSGAGIRVLGAANHFANCKSWYTDGGGHGWYVSGTGVQLAGCESQDNTGVGLMVDSGQVIASGFQSDGDSAGCLVAGDGHLLGADCEIDIFVTVADRLLPSYAVAVNNVHNGAFRAKVGYGTYRRANKTAADALEVFKLVGPASDALANQFEYVGHDAVQSPAPSFMSGIVTPDAADGLTVFVTLSSNVSIAPLVHRSSVAPGKRLRFVFTQGSTGGRTVTWDASYGGAPAVAAAANAVTVVGFLNVSTTMTPRWVATGP